MAGQKVFFGKFTADTLPKEVLWTGRKPHLGWLYSEAITRLATNRGELDLPLLKEQLDELCRYSGLDRRMAEI